ncbi:TonB-dependent receptor [Escherichia coli]|uniref:TonB-dependent receptor n=1 Tax=Escherichia coli TaxID=562 RepID=A0A376MY23_ECOLX|nr:TonB-dependent receptor [Escherichia coli]
MPDGQGQTSNIDLSSVQNVEVLRGPFSALYGNASGGVMNVTTQTGQQPPTIEASSYYGSFGSWRYGLKATGRNGRRHTARRCRLHRLNHAFYDPRLS